MTQFAARSAKGRQRRITLVGAAVLPALFAGPAWAHPEDEFCDGMTGLDPELCRAIAEMDASGERFADALDVSADMGVWDVFETFVGLGFAHILPLGLDHILFVLALLLATPRFRELLVLVSLFTLAHSITLGLGAAGYVTASPGFVEPLIALSIVVLAADALFQRRTTPWRPAIVFGFGLFHGLGFASMLSARLADSAFIPALLGFNLGVEFGQLAVIAAALALFWGVDVCLKPLPNSASARTLLTRPAATAIAFAGSYWFVERIGLI